MSICSWTSSLSATELNYVNPSFTGSTSIVNGSAGSAVIFPSEPILNRLKIAWVISFFILSFAKR